MKKLAFILISTIFALVLMSFLPGWLNTTHSPVNALQISTKTQGLPPADITILQGNILDCDDCYLAPVGKIYTLKSNYVPELEQIDLYGGGMATPETARALRDLFRQAESQGQTLGIVSAYRSFQTQASLFENYVAQEMARGLSRQQAENQANTYSARPGQSEHQLGTTIDLACRGCALEGMSPANLSAWGWLANNALKFGFVLSYPEGRELETGYIYEPWHWRYVGVRHAQLFTLQTSLVLSDWLAP